MFAGEETRYSPSHFARFENILIVCALDSSSHARNVGGNGQHSMIVPQPPP